jgi:hypothetical protein
MGDELKIYLEEIKKKIKKIQKYKI